MKREGETHSLGVILRRHVVLVVVVLSIRRIRRHVLVVEKDALDELAIPTITRENNPHSSFSRRAWSILPLFESSVSNGISGSRSAF